MKIRAGFVSNSSSSSFIFIGRHRDIKDITLKELRRKKFFVKLDYAYYNGEGDLIFRIDSRMLLFLQKNPDMVSCAWEHVLCGEPGTELKSANLKGDYLLMHYDVAYASDDITSLEELQWYASRAN